MNRVLANVEFFSYEGEIWVRESDGSTRRLLETDYDFIRNMVEFIATFYPKAFKALEAEYAPCSANPPYFRFRMVSRFIRCNFGALDNTPDIAEDLRCNFEYINCPLRGECRHDSVICRPEFATALTPAERRVMELAYKGMKEEDIASNLCISPLTVHTHIRHAYSRMGVHSRAEFVKYATLHNIFS